VIVIYRKNAENILYFCHINIVGMAKYIAYIYVVITVFLL